MTNVDYETGDDLQFGHDAFSGLERDIRTGTIANLQTETARGVVGP
jgi:hypothetical protein